MPLAKPVHVHGPGCNHGSGHDFSNMFVSGFCSPCEPEKSEKSEKPVSPVNLGQSTDNSEPIKPIKLTNPIKLTKPINPARSVNPIKPINVTHVHGPGCNHQPRRQSYNYSNTGFYSPAKGVKPRNSAPRLRQQVEEPQYTYINASHHHGNHWHFNLTTKIACDHDHHHHDCNHCEDTRPQKFMSRNAEGCPCCRDAVDLDEIVSALNELAKNSGSHGHAFWESPDFSSGTHWGIFLGISGPLALMGLTAAIRNVNGTLSNRKNLKVVIQGLKKDIKKYEEQRDHAVGEDRAKLAGVVTRLKAFRDTLEYSKFDTDFNFAVPGVINGAASTIVLSSAVVSSPWALPVIALYAGCQTTRNAYDLWRTWNKILPEEIRENVQLNMKVGTRKINQITESKRKFYTVNTLGFLVFTVGGLVTTLALLSIIGLAGLIVGMSLLAVGAVVTAITNNIWVAQFKPRNGDLGVDRKELNLVNIKQEIAERREIKRLLKNYIANHLPTKTSQSFGCALLSSFPFCNEKGKTMLHEVNKARITQSDGTDFGRLDLLERMINIKIILKQSSRNKAADFLLDRIVGLKLISKTTKNKFGLISFNKANPICEEIFKACKDLDIDTLVLERFIKNYIMKSSDEHDTTIKYQEQYFDKLKSSGVFIINDNEITFDLKALECRRESKEAFMNSLEECLLFDYVEKLKYEQYGLNDFYWALERQNQKRFHYLDYSYNPVHQADDNAHQYTNRYYHDSSNVYQSRCRQNYQDLDSRSMIKNRGNERSGGLSNPSLRYFAQDGISHNKKDRQIQIGKQNEVIDNILAKSPSFILASRTRNREKNQTIFVYTHPYYQNPDHPDYEARKIIYIRDDATKRIDVLYGEKANAFIIERPDRDNNGLIMKIGEKEIRYYGQRENSSMRSFRGLETLAPQLVNGADVTWRSVMANRLNTGVEFQRLAA